MRNKKKWFGGIYYLLLLLLFLSWNDMQNVPGAFIRIAYMFAIMLPCYFVDKKWLPAVMTLFLTLSTHGLTTSYLPARQETYIVALLGGLFIGRLGKHDVKIQSIILFLFLYTTVINIITSFEINMITGTLLIVYILTYYIDFQDEESFKMLSLSLLVSALSLSVSLLINADQVVSIEGISEIEGAERLAFRDVNYTGCVVSIGMIAALIEILTRRSGKIIYYLSILTLIVSIIALAKNASRGSFVAFTVAGVVILWFSRTKSMYKFVLTVGVVVVIYFLYTNNMFDLIASRFEGDSTGSGRLFIWQNKLEDFSSQNIFSWIMGMGHTNGREFDLVNVKGVTGFHNDFLAFFVCYGFIGLVSFIIFFLYPLRFLSNKNPNRPFVISSLLALVVICMTLEPIVAGRIPYYIFWIYIIWLSKLGKIQNVSHR